MSIGIIYGILKYVVGEFIDFIFVIVLIICGYKNWLVVEILYSIMQFLFLCYCYKFYHGIFARHFFKPNFKYDFTGTVNFNKRLNSYIYLKLRGIIGVLMPGNAIGLIMLYTVAYIKFFKVGFNGNKNIIFKKYFGIDIRESFDRYIMWYYKGINSVVEFFIHKPLLRIIVLPSIIRNAIINASIFGMLKARIFVFVFLSLLSINEITLYGNLTGQQIILLEYIYFLIIWPTIAKYLKLDEKIREDLNLRLGYISPKDLYNAFGVVMLNSVSLNLFVSFGGYLRREKLDKDYIVCFYNLMLPGWMELLLNFNVSYEMYLQKIDSKLNINVLFGRTEMPYYSFIAFLKIRNGKLLLLASAVVVLFRKGFFPYYLSTDIINEVYKKLELFVNLGGMLIMDVYLMFNESELKDFFDIYTYDGKIVNNIDLFLKIVARKNFKVEIMETWYPQTIFVDMERYKEILIAVQFFNVLANRLQNVHTKEIIDWVFRFVYEFGGRDDKQQMDEQTKFLGKIVKLISINAWDIVEMQEILLVLNRYLTAFGDEKTIFEEEKYMLRPLKRIEKIIKEEL